MSLFDWLLVGHLVGDFLLQTDGMARYKEENWSWMLRHVGMYLVVMTVLLGVYVLGHPVSLWAVGAMLLFIGGTHIVLDRRTFTLWWMCRIGVSSDLNWLSIVTDQVFHILVLAAVAQVITSLGG
jgi:dolichyl-phosphate-mannose--protein O-mannosyl transferase